VQKQKGRGHQALSPFIVRYNWFFAYFAGGVAAVLVDVEAAVVVAVAVATVVTVAVAVAVVVTVGLAGADSPQPTRPTKQSVATNIPILRIIPLLQ
jgi:hypothetical protein